MWGNITLHSCPSSFIPRILHIIYSIVHSFNKCHRSCELGVSLTQGARSPVSIFHVPEATLDARDTGVKEVFSAFGDLWTERVSDALNYYTPSLVGRIQGCNRWTEKSPSDQNSPTADHLGLCKCFWSPHDALQYFMLLFLPWERELSGPLLCN